MGSVEWDGKIFYHKILNLCRLVPVLEKAMESHSSILAWQIPWMEEPGGLQSLELQRSRHNLATKQQRISVQHNNTKNLYNA